MSLTINDNGYITLSTIHNGYYIHKTYCFYTLRDAKRMFSSDGNIVDEQSPQPSEPDTDAPVREKPTTKPGKPKRENPFEPKHKPKPKAKLPKQLSFDSIGLDLKMAAE